MVPAAAIIFNADGLQVAVVEMASRACQSFGGTGLGTEVEVRDGVKKGDRVILNPPVDLVDGAKVQIRSSDPKA